MKVKVYGAGELVPAFEVFDAVSKDTAQMSRLRYVLERQNTDSAVFFRIAFWV